MYGILIFLYRYLDFAFPIALCIHVCVKYLLCKLDMKFKYEAVCKIFSWFVIFFFFFPLFVFYSFVDIFVSIYICIYKRKVCVHIWLCLSTCTFFVASCMNWELRAVYGFNKKWWHSACIRFHAVADVFIFFVCVRNFKWLNLHKHILCL